MRFEFALPLVLAMAATLAAANPVAPPTPDVTLCCPSIDSRIPRGTLLDSVLTSVELCCGYSDGTTCCYTLNGSLLTPGNACLVFLSTC